MYSFNIMSLKTVYLSMIIAVTASNYFVQFPLNDWLTWGALTYPLTFLINELTHAFHGPKIARRVVYVGFSLAVIFSIALATPRIACASGTAFLAAQLADIYVFRKFRQWTWWCAPFFASLFASFLDTLLFWYLAFWGDTLPFFTLMTGDFLVKFALDLMMLVPFRLLIRKQIMFQK